VPAIQAAGPARAGQRQGKYLLFHLGREEFGVQVLKVREIMGLQEITEVPQMPAFVRGVINLRGKVIPVVDLRRKFGLANAPDTPHTCIVVMQVAHEGGPLLTGVIVDGVSEVATLQDGEIEDAPGFGGDLDAPYILGLAKVKGKVKILLDIDQALACQELKGLEVLAAAEQAV
jgi:purine-binding chemotaxis protein CheW